MPSESSLQPTHELPVLSPCTYSQSSPNPRSLQMKWLLCTGDAPKAGQADQVDGGGQDEGRGLPAQRRDVPRRRGKPARCLEMLLGV